MHWRYKMATVTLEHINRNILNIHREIVEIKEEINDLLDVELEVKPEYLEKLDKIEKGRFLSRKEFEKEMVE